jgi:hypothetical protein
MSLGKYTSLEEARKAKKLERFCHDNPSKADKKKMDDLFVAMTGKAPQKPTEDEKT